MDFETGWTNDCIQKKPKLPNRITLTAAEIVATESQPSILERRRQFWSLAGILAPNNHIASNSFSSKRTRTMSQIRNGVDASVDIGYSKRRFFATSRRNRQYAIRDAQFMGKFSSIMRLFLLTSSFIAGCFAANALGQQSEPANFRIDTDIYLDPSEPPVKRLLTLFRGGVYYDFEDDLLQVTMIDPLRERIVLLDRKRQVLCEVSCAELMSDISKAQDEITSKINEMIANPQIIDEDISKKTFTMGTEHIQYICKYETPQNKDIVRQYVDFANWSSRLNAVYPPHMMPYVRLQLNDTLAERNALPIDLTLKTIKRMSEQEISCKLLSNWRLSSDDQASITRVGTMLTQFRRVNVQEYFNPPTK
jgi:hypothetical protein